MYISESEQKKKYTTKWLNENVFKTQTQNCPPKPKSNPFKKLELRTCSIRNRPNSGPNLEKQNFEPFWTQVRLQKLNYEPNWNLQTTWILNLWTEFNPTLVHKKNLNFFSAQNLYFLTPSIIDVVCNSSILYYHNMEGIKWNE